MSDKTTIAAASQLLDEADSQERLDHLARNIAQEVDEFTSEELDGLRTIYRARREELQHGPA